MSKPPKPPRRSASPTPSCLSGVSLQSSLQAELETFWQGGSSPQLRRFFEAFESAVPFSQLDQEGGRGPQVVLQNVGLLNHIWANRDKENAALCFDKHDGRAGTKIYNPPRRGPGGVVIPCSLDGTKFSCAGAVQSINIVNNNISMQPVQYPSAHRETLDTEANRENRSRKRAVQSTFKALTKPQITKKNALKDNHGRFTKQKIVSSQHLRGTAPSIPLNTRGLRRLLRQWVKGDKERGLKKPLAEFSSDERNGRDSTGKPNKTLYSKRRTVALATLLALQDALENRKSFAQAIGVQMSPEEVEKLPLSSWENVAKSFLKTGGRKMTQLEITDLGIKLYLKEILDMLPEGEN